MLRSVGYDPATETLEAEFQSGRVFEYYKVPAEIYEQLMGSPSLGSYFRDFVIDMYGYRRLR